MVWFFRNTTSHAHTINSVLCFGCYGCHSLRDRSLTHHMYSRVGVAYQARPALSTALPTRACHWPWVCSMTLRAKSCTHKHKHTHTDHNHIKQTDTQRVQNSPCTFRKCIEVPPFTCGHPLHKLANVSPSISSWKHPLASFRERERERTCLEVCVLALWELPMGVSPLWGPADNTPDHLHEPGRVQVISISWRPPKLLKDQMSHHLCDWAGSGRRGGGGNLLAFQRKTRDKIRRGDIGLQGAFEKRLVSLAAHCLKAQKGRESHSLCLSLVLTHKVIDESCRPSKPGSLWLNMQGNNDARVSATRGEGRGAKTTIAVWKKHTPTESSCETKQL